MTRILLSTPSYLPSVSNMSLTASEVKHDEGPGAAALASQRSGSLAGSIATTALSYPSDRDSTAANVPASPPTRRLPFSSLPARPVLPCSFWRLQHPPYDSDDNLTTQWASCHLTNMHAIISLLLLGPGTLMLLYGGGVASGVSQWRFARRGTEYLRTRNRPLLAICTAASCVPTAWVGMQVAGIAIQAALEIAAAVCAPTTSPDPSVNYLGWVTHSWAAQHGLRKWPLPIRQYTAGDASSVPEWVDSPRLSSLSISEVVQWKRRMCKEWGYTKEV